MIKHFCDRCGDDLEMEKSQGIAMNGATRFAYQRGTFRIEVSCTMVAELEPGEKLEKSPRQWQNAEICPRCIAVIANGEMPQTDPAS